MDQNSQSLFLFFRLRPPKAGKLESEVKNMKKELTNEQMLNAMINHPAKVITYAKYNENSPLECPICGWEGTPKSSDYVNTDSHYCLDVCCPDCEKMLLIAEYPLA